MRVMPRVQATVGGHHALWLARSPPLPCRPPQALIASSPRAAPSPHRPPQASAAAPPRALAAVGECSSVVARLVLMEELDI
jgi:hypothetical protein